MIRTPKRKCILRGGSASSRGGYFWSPYMWHQCNKQWRSNNYVLYTEHKYVQIDISGGDNWKKNNKTFQVKLEFLCQTGSCRSHRLNVFFCFLLLLFYLLLQCFVVDILLLRRLRKGNNSVVNCCTQKCNEQLICTLRDVLTLAPSMTALSFSKTRCCSFL